MLQNNSPKKLKRLALFSGNYNYVVDGPVLALNQLVGFLERKGIEVLVFAPTVKQPAFEHTGTLISVPSLPVPGRSEYRFSLGLFGSARKTLDQFNPDLVHLAAPDRLGFSVQKWAQKLGKPMVASFHTRFDTYPRYYGMPWAEKYLTAIMQRFYRRCAHVYVPSESMVQVLKEQEMSDQLRIWTRGVDTDRFNPGRRDMDWRRSLGIADSEIVIAFVGRLVLEKGIDLYASVVNGLKEKGYPVRGLVVGDGPAREDFEAKLPDGVFVGFQGGTDLARAYASADIFFNGSITETFGNVTLEAMASGLPAVCADATGSRTLVSDGENGYLVDYGDTRAFIDKISALIEIPDLMTAMSQASLKRSKGYSWDSVLQGLLDQYEEVLSISE